MKPNIFIINMSFSLMICNIKYTILNVLQVAYWITYSTLYASLNSYFVWDRVKSWGLKVFEVPDFSELITFYPFQIEIGFMLFHFFTEQRP
jgi:hypothetical protein